MTARRILTISVLAPLLMGIGLVTTGGAYQSPDKAAILSPPVLSASSSTEVAGAADRVVDKLDQTILGDQPEIGTARINHEGVSTSTSVGPARPVPADEQPQLGETVLVQYADATVVHHAVTAGCTVSGTAGNPYKTSSGRVQATTSYQQSGCTNVVQARGGLDMYWGFEWRDFKSSTYVPTNGALHTQYLGWACQNSNQSPWRSTVANKYSGVTRMYLIVISPTQNLACGGNPP